MHHLLHHTVAAVRGILLDELEHLRQKFLRRALGGRRTVLDLRVGQDRERVGDGDDAEGQEETSEDFALLRVRREVAVSGWASGGERKAAGRAGVGWGVSWRGQGEGEGEGEGEGQRRARA